MKCARIVIDLIMKVNTKKNASGKSGQLGGWKAQTQLKPVKTGQLKSIINEIVYIEIISYEQPLDIITILAPRWNELRRIIALRTLASFAFNLEL